MVQKKLAIETRDPSNRKRGYTPLCAHCLVNNEIQELTILKALEKGMEQNGMMVIAKPGAVLGTPYGMLAPLIRILRLKGFRII